MTARGALPLALVLLLAGAGCAGRKGATPADLMPSGATTSAPREAPKPKPAPEAPPVTRSGSQAGPAAAVVASPGSRADASKPPAGEAPPATASAHVFSPQQAASASERPSPAIAPQGGVPSAPAGSESEDAEPPPDDEAAPSAAPGELRLVVVASASQVAAGEVVTVDVLAASSTPVLDAPLHLTFDPAVIAYVDGSPGDFLTQGGSSVVFLADGQSRPGDVAIALGRVGRERGASGSGLLCRVRFRGAASGSTAVTVGQAKAWDGAGEPIPVRSTGTAVAVR